MSNTLSLATRLRTMSDAQLHRAMTGREIRTSGIHDLFDLAEAFLDTVGGAAGAHTTGSDDSGGHRCGGSHHRLTRRPRPGTRVSGTSSRTCRSTPTGRGTRRSSPVARNTPPRCCSWNRATKVMPRTVQSTSSFDDTSDGPVSEPGGSRRTAAARGGGTRPEGGPARGRPSRRGAGVLGDDGHSGAPRRARARPGPRTGQGRGVLAGHQAPGARHGGGPRHASATFLSLAAGAGLVALEDGSWLLTERGASVAAASLRATVGGSGRRLGRRAAVRRSTRARAPGRTPSGATNCAPIRAGTTRQAASGWPAGSPSARATRNCSASPPAAPPARPAPCCWPTTTRPRRS